MKSENWDRNLRCNCRHSGIASPLQRDDVALLWQLFGPGTVGRVVGHQYGPGRSFTGQLSLFS
jgi:hypothetical protein